MDIVGYVIIPLVMIGFVYLFLGHELFPSTTDKILDRAVQIFGQHELDEYEEAFSARTAFCHAVAEVITTDAIAYKVLREVAHPGSDYYKRLTFVVANDGTDDLTGYVRSLLESSSERLGRMVAKKIPAYGAIMRHRNWQAEQAWERSHF